MDSLCGGMDSRGSRGGGRRSNVEGALEREGACGGVWATRIEDMIPFAAGDQRGAPSTPPRRPTGVEAAWPGAGEDTPPARGDVGWVEISWSWRDGAATLRANVLASTEGGVCRGARRRREGRHPLVLEGDAGETTIEGVPGRRAPVAAASGAAPLVAAPSGAAPSGAAPSSTARATADGDVGGFDALIMVSGGGGAGGRGGKVRTGIVARTVAAGDQRAPAHLLQRGHGEDTLRARAVIRSARAAIGRGGDRHGRALLRGSLLVSLLGREDRGGTMRTPRWSREPEDFRLTASNKKRANPSNCIRV